ncbi:hypothetical protein [Pseudomonas aeruginosa]|uniref:hypothetical protein n=1 Tax=Pseudomonas aeruginosa TaxID=287 RepID=UPI00101C820E|nr:hypothetical protein [Pseudomonas aeruginosa]RYI97753.1 hypothetical protein EWI26_03975 [Pseudomonas aeruginosa]
MHPNPDCNVIVSVRRSYSAVIKDLRCADIPEEDQRFRCPSCQGSVYEKTDDSPELLQLLRNYVAGGAKAVSMYELKLLGFDPWREGPPSRSARRARFVEVLDALLVKAGYVVEDGQDLVLAEQVLVDQTLRKDGGELRNPV